MQDKEVALVTGAKTNLNNYSGTETVEEGAAEALRVALLGPDSPTGSSRTQRVERSRGDRYGKYH